ncbi:uncharacterized protein LOC126379916 [Pectinophora gossypiella]|uniref:uncharacterized protein LOC126366822 n=1 Tax=Pectinophora gossypiella TaxID=13191 RepID=UPI00214F0FFB|nr:uncharacterized protein LOC126366822 [Pectinophora gossypiella]XP_049868869.1 uncharacterized protein LOC126368765 [Pectinophora gossypiella]XP_049884885.1 uncharacterized protein LOC126379916 [Pectinophora gossypiella]
MYLIIYLRRGMWNINRNKTDIFDNCSYNRELRSCSSTGELWNLGPLWSVLEICARESMRAALDGGIKFDCERIDLKTQDAKKPHHQAMSAYAGCVMCKELHQN